MDSILITENTNLYLSQALELCKTNARVKALTDAFGLNVSMVNIIREMEKRGKTSDFFYSRSEVETNGHWEKDTRDPEYTVAYKDGYLLIRCQVWGKASKVIRHEPRVRYKMTNWKHEEAVEFPIGDSEQPNERKRLYLDFHADADGILAVYLQGEKTTQLLPLSRDAGKPKGFPVKAGKDYHLFTGEEHGQYYFNLSRDEEMEFMQLVILFTPERGFQPTIDRKGKTLYELDTPDFEEWLSKIYQKDEQMAIRRANIILIPNE